MKKTSVVRSCCLTVISAMIIFLGIYVLIPQQASADDGIVKYPVTGGELTFDKSTGTVTACDKTVTEAVIPAEIDGTAVKQIGQNAFSGCRELASVTLPEGLTRIASGSFDYTKITSISVPATVTYADSGAFYRAESLEDINVAEGNTTYCSKEGVMFNKEMTMLKRYPTGKTCDKYTVPSGVTQIYVGAFSYSKNVSEIAMPDSVDNIGSDAFRECSGLKKVHLPDSLKIIPTRCFYGCTALADINMPASLTEICSSAFQKCSSLVSVDIPAGCSSISSNSFAGCEGMTAINVEDGNSSYCSKDGVLFTADMKELMTCPAGKEGATYTVPDSVKVIERNAFHGNKNFKEIILPEGLEKIRAAAFYGCHIRNLTIPDSVTEIEGTETFMACGSLESVVLSKNLTEIPDSAFYGCTSLKEVVIPDKVMKIDHAAFGGCSLLSSVTIPESVETIADSAFSRSSSVTIYGVAGSYAETFAKQHDIPFNGDSRKSQQIKCSDVFEKTYGDDDFDLEASTTADTNDVTLQYDSLSPEVATVSDAGRVTIKSAGDAQIKITAPETEAYRSATKTVTVNVGKFQRVITTDKDEYDVAYGDSTINTGLSVTGEGGVSCEADRSSVAMAVIHSGSGLITPGKPGTAIVTYKAEGSDNYSEAEKQITVRVNKAENRITSGQNRFSKKLGDVFTLEIKALTDIQYKSDNSSVATVTPDGRVQVCGAGAAVITATAAENEYYKSIEKNITVNVSKAVQTVNAPSSFTKTFGAAPFSIGASAKTALKYRSSNTNIATVSPSGKVTLKNPGKAYITATAVSTKDYEPASRSISVSSSMKKPSLTLQAQKGRKIKISWSQVPGASKYEVYMYDSSKKKYVKRETKSGRVKSTTNKGLRAGKTYSYKVRAYRQVGKSKVYSSYSSVKKAKAKK